MGILSYPINTLKTLSWTSNGYFQYIVPKNPSGREVWALAPPSIWMTHSEVQFSSRNKLRVLRCVWFYLVCACACVWESNKKLPHTLERKIAFYGHPSTSHTCIGGSCLTTLHPLSVKGNRWTQMDESDAVIGPTAGGACSVLRLTGWSDGVWSAEAGHRELNCILYTHTHTPLSPPDPCLNRCFTTLTCGPFSGPILIRTRLLFM